MIFQKIALLIKLKNFNEVKIIQNKKKTEIGSFNQIKAFEEAQKLSEGEIVLLLDSDDYFNETKVEEIVNFFNDNKDAKIVFDYPIVANKEKFINIKKKKKLINNLWPYIHPTKLHQYKKRYI